MYVIIRDGRWISKPFATQDECVTEAKALGLVKRMPVISPMILADGVSIRDLFAPVKP